MGIAGAAAVMAVLLLLLLVPARSARTSLALDIEIHAAAPPAAPWRPIVAVVGDEVSVRTRGAQAIWVYQDTVLIERCPGGSTCERSPRSLTLRFRLRTVGRVRILAITGADGLEPLGSFDADVLAARARGDRLELRAIVASPGP